MPKYAPRVKRSPWAKLTTPVVLNKSTMPMAISPVMAPSAMPEKRMAMNRAMDELGDLEHFGRRGSHQVSPSIVRPRGQHHHEQCHCGRDPPPRQESTNRMFDTVFGWH